MRKKTSNSEIIKSKSKSKNAGIPKIPGLILPDLNTPPSNSKYNVPSVKKVKKPTIPHNRKKAQSSKHVVGSPKGISQGVSIAPIGNKETGNKLATPVQQKKQEFFNSPVQPNDEIKETDEENKKEVKEEPPITLKIPGMSSDKKSEKVESKHKSGGSSDMISVKKIDMGNSLAPMLMVIPPANFKGEKMILPIINEPISPVKVDRNQLSSNIVVNLPPEEKVDTYENPRFITRAETTNISDPKMGSPKSKRSKFQLQINTPNTNLLAPVTPMAIGTRQSLMTPGIGLGGGFASECKSARLPPNMQRRKSICPTGTAGGVFGGVGVAGGGGNDVNPQSVQQGAILLEAARRKGTSSSNIKVVARFRPINKYELELTQNGLGGECVKIIKEKKSVVIPDENLTMTMDNVYGPESKQEEIYDFMGKDTIDDVLKGYNGTIFAYGQTGSGKTFTMYGLDIADKEIRGIIPRAAEQIFINLANIQEEVELEIRCSMLELYKEKLQDLFLPVGSPEKELKIKESASKGIYVSGLTEECVGSEEEILELIESGNELRHVAETRSNAVSSRSHSIFILQLTQKYPNESEKRGKLNLVDLAGSEKVGKTGATGQTLEEAKKINSSLSSIGNVIHALVFKTSHVPYRDSKLTRILQESLGGNYKTSLVVTCSTHSAHMEETISTLRFAQRTRAIKNVVKINVKQSPAQMQAVIDHLTFELQKANKEIVVLKDKIQGFEYMGDWDKGDKHIDGEKDEKNKEKYNEKNKEKYKYNEKYDKDNEKRGGEKIISGASTYGPSFPVSQFSIQTQKRRKESLSLSDDGSDSSSGDNLSVTSQKSMPESLFGSMGKDGWISDISEHGLLHNSPYKMSQDNNFLKGPRRKAITTKDPKIIWEKYSLWEHARFHIQGMANLQLQRIGSDPQISEAKLKSKTLNPNSDDSKYSLFPKNLTFVPEFPQTERCSYKNNEEENKIYEEKISKLNLEILKLKTEKEKMNKQMEEYKEEIEKFRKMHRDVKNELNEIFEKNKLEKYESSNQAKITEHTKKQIERFTRTIESLTNALVQSENQGNELVKQREEYLSNGLKQGLDHQLFDWNFVNYVGSPIFQDNMDGWMSDCSPSHARSMVMDSWSRQITKERLDRRIDLRQEESKYENVPLTDQLCLLQAQIIECGIYNFNLQRVVSALQWRLMLESGKSKIKESLSVALQSNLNNLECLLEDKNASIYNLNFRIAQLEKANKQIKPLLEQGSKANILQTPTNKVTIIKRFRSNRFKLDSEVKSSLLNKPLDDPIPQIKYSPIQEINSSALFPPEKSSNHATFEKSFLSVCEDDSFRLDDGARSPGAMQNAKVIKSHFPYSKMQTMRNRTGVSTRDLGFGSFANGSVDNDKRDIETIKQLQGELDLQISRGDQLKKAFLKSQNQLFEINQIIKDMQESTQSNLLSETRKWENEFNEMKEKYEEIFFAKDQELNEFREDLGKMLNNYNMRSSQRTKKISGGSIGSGNEFKLRKLERRSMADIERSSGPFLRGYSERGSVTQRSRIIQREHIISMRISNHLGDTNVSSIADISALPEQIN